MALDEVVRVPREFRTPPRPAARPGVRVSVVVPCFQYARFLESAVTSALEQREVEVDVIVVDDASTDGSADVARTLTAELATFRLRNPAAANESFESWRERPHDDLVLAVALAAWLAEEAGPPRDPEPDEPPTVVRVR